MPKLGIIIPTRRETELLKRCLSFIEQHTTDYTVYTVFGERGFTEKLNDGLAQVKDEYAVLLHDDIEVTPGWADVLPGENEVGAFRLGEMNDSYEIWGGKINPSGFCTDSTDHPDYSFFLCLHRDVLEKVGLFDERFTGPWCQDVQMGIQIRKAGYTINCLPGKIVHRNGHGSGVKDERQEFYLERKYGVKL